jgi:hypothetical protein
MPRENIERQKELKPKRMEYAKGQIMKRRLPIIDEDATKIVFTYKGEKVTLYPYSGWHTGKSITDGRGVDNLLKQLT